MATTEMFFAATSASGLLVAVAAFWRGLATTFRNPQEQQGNPFLVLGLWGGVMPAFALQLVLSLPTGGGRYVQLLLCVLICSFALGVAWAYSQLELQSHSRRHRWRLRGASGLVLVLLFWLLAAVQHTY